MRGLNIVFFIRETWIGIKRSSLMSIIAIAIATISLLIFGFFMIISINMNHLSNMMLSKLEINVFMKATTTQKSIQNIQKKIMTVGDIETVTLIPKEEAWKSFKTNYQHLALGKTLKTNPLPDTLRIKLSKKGVIKEVATHIKQIDPLIDDVVYGGRIAERLEVIATLTKIGGIILVSLLGVSTLFIIVNTIRLTVIARQEEIEIMNLVGASDAFIRIPFIIEGCIIGLIGAGLSIGALSSFYGYILHHIQLNMPFIPVVNDKHMLVYIYTILGGAGVFLGVLGAYISVTKSLKKIKI